MFTTKQRPTWPSQFFADTRGNITMIFALISLPLMAVLALAVDMNMSNATRNKLQANLDSALLSAARESIQGGTQSEIEAEFDAYFNAKLDEMGDRISCGQPVLVQAPLTGDVTGSVICTATSILGGFVNNEHVDFNLEAAAKFGLGKVDVAFVFDLSGSMNHASAAGYNQPSRLTALKSAATSAVTQLLASNPNGSDDVRIGMVGYSHAVNAGPYFTAATGLTPTRTYTHIVNDTPGLDTAGYYSSHLKFVLYDSRTDLEIAEISDGSVINVTDDQIDYLNIGVTVKPGSWLVGNTGSIYFTFNGSDHTQVENETPYSVFGDTNGDFQAGAVPEGWNSVRAHVYEGDDRTQQYWGWLNFEFKIQTPAEESITITNTCTFERNTTEWTEATAPRFGHFISGAEAVWDEEDDDWDTPSNCNGATPVPLTSNLTTLTDYITSLTAGGGTAGHLGINWGRYLISPDWAAVWPTASAPLGYNVPDTKKVLILMTDGNFNRTYHSNLGTSFEQAQSYCDQAKTDGILIYSVAFNAPEDGEAILDYCASVGEFSFEADNSQELLDAYTAIANSIADLRLAY